jgi:hypothetical protein
LFAFDILLICRYLELENSRLRQFYSKKIEGLQKKYQSQLHALKRGSAPSAGIPSLSDVSLGIQNPQLVSQLSEENQLLNEKITVLEDELLQTAEELGRLKALSAVSPPSDSLLQPTPAPAPPMNEEFMSRIHQLEAEIQKLQSSQTKQSFEPSSTSSVPSPTEMSLLREIDHLRSELREALRQQEKYHQQLGEVEKDYQRNLLNKEELEGEVLYLKDQLRKPQSPKMQQFMLMEQKLSELEGRLSRRESELLKLLEQSKLSANMERMRLQSIHEQVRCRCFAILFPPFLTLPRSSWSLVRSCERRTSSCCSSKENWNN